MGRTPELIAPLEGHAAAQLAKLVQGERTSGVGVILRMRTTQSVDQGRQGQGIVSLLAKGDADLVHL